MKKIARNILFFLIFPLFLVACTKDKNQLEIFSVPLSNEDVAIKNFNIISSNDQIYLENHYFLDFQDENIKNISFDIFDKEDKFIYSFVHGVDLSKKPAYEPEEKTGVIINTNHFRDGDNIKVVVKYIYVDETEKTFTKKIQLKKQ